MQTLTRTELLTQIFGKDKPKGSQEYGTLLNLANKKKIPFEMINRQRLFKQSDAEEIKTILLEKIDNIKNPEFVSSLDFSKQMDVSKTTMQSWLDQGLIPGFVKKKGISVDQLIVAKEAVEKLKEEKSNILGTHTNQAHLFPCKICGTMFQVKSSHYSTGQKLTCSDECSEKYRLEQKPFYGSPSNERIDISTQVKEIIEGELLGDGCLVKPGRSINVCFQYSTASKEYIEYLQQELSVLDMSEIKKYSIFSGFNKNKKYISYKMNTKTNPVLTEIYDQWYINNFKRVPKDLVLTPKVCLHWWIGDGCLSTNKKTQQQYIELSAQGFLEEDVDLLIQKLIDLRFESHKYEVGISKKNNKKFVIIISSRSMTKFLKYIGPCPVECYKYKWNILDPTYEKYERYIYSTGDVAKKLGQKSQGAIQYYASTDWFKEAHIDCTKMWSRLRFSEQGFQQLQNCLIKRGLIH